MQNVFLPILKGKTVIVGIGNPLRGDDGFGPALVGRLQDHVDWICIDAGNAPENYFGRILKEAPDTILLVDVAQLDLSPGQYRLLRPDDILKYGFTTHDMSSRMLIEFLQSQIQAEVFMLGVQPQHLAIGNPMSECVMQTLAEVAQLIQEAGSCTRPI